MISQAIAFIKRAHNARQAFGPIAGTKRCARIGDALNHNFIRITNHGALLSVLFGENFKKTRQKTRQRKKGYQSLLKGGKASNKRLP
jgi:hypothetical protein